MFEGMGLFRLTSPASGSVPVLTDHRSTPQVGLSMVSVIDALPGSMSGFIAQGLTHHPLLEQ